MELTVSVSTVIFLAEPSPDGFPLPPTEDVVYAFVGGFGRGAAAGAAVFALPSPFPLSLPLSLPILALMVLLDALSPLSISVSDLDVPFSTPSGTRPNPRAGVLGTLISWTVSSVELAPPYPLAGDLVPDTGVTSSTSASLVAGLLSSGSAGCSDRWVAALIEGTFCSVLRGERTFGLLTGGGDLSRGETGHRGGSLGSAVVDGFWGVGALMVESDGVGFRVGVVDVERARCCVEGLLLFVLAARDGLTSL